jgi:hypothetical protein
MLRCQIVHFKLKPTLTAAATGNWGLKKSDDNYGI